MTLHCFVDEDTEATNKREGTDRVERKLEDAWKEAGSAVHTQHTSNGLLTSIRDT